MLQHQLFSLLYIFANTSSHRRKECLAEAEDSLLLDVICPSIAFKVGDSEISLLFFMLHILTFNFILENVVLSSCENKVTGPALQQLLKLV